MKGTFTAIGTGPGNPDGLTQQAIEKIRSCNVVVLPNKDKEKCISLQIAIKALPEIQEKQMIFCDFPMTKDSEILEKARKDCVNQVIQLLENGRNVVFLTLGDPVIYSTAMYIYGMVEEKGCKSEIVNGITSFCAAAAALGISLADNDEQLHILPGSYDVSGAFQLSGTLVFMKSGKNLAQLKEFLLKSQSDWNFDFYAVSNAGMENQVLCRSLSDFNENAGYLTLVIIKNIQKKVQDGHKFFQNRSCKYFPCHKNISPEDFNCLFCYCPLYYKGTECGGNYVIKENGIKSCVNCTFPHHRENYQQINIRLK